MKSLIFSKNESLRLDKFLVEELPEFSRSQIQKMIKNGQVKINDRLESAHFLLKEGDKVSLEIIKEAKEKPITKEELEIIFQNDDYLIINKPTGLIVHSGEGIKEPTLTNWLVKKFPKIKKVGEDPKRPGIVHRLDKEVTGLMVIALNQKMFEHLKNQFQTHQVKKTYQALVYGKVPTDEGTINFPLERSEISGKMAARPEGASGRESITNFLVIKRFSRYTFMELTILTGRTHQIRAHLQAYGYPVVGDKLYFNKKIKDNLKLNRLFLHSHVLGFNDQEGSWQEYRSELPGELKNILNNLK